MNAIMPTNLATQINKTSFLKYTLYQNVHKER